MTIFAGFLLPPSGRFAHHQRGVALIVSLLLLLVVTLLAVGMYRSVGGSEKVAGNLREKQRALHAAVSAQKYAEWWLSMRTTVNSGTTCSAVSTTLQVCSNALANPSAVPWVSGTTPVGVSYTPPGMVVPTTTESSGPDTYFKAPMLYIYYLGTASGVQGAVYQIDAVGYGGNSSSLAVVESTFQVSNGVKNLGGL